MKNPCEIIICGDICPTKDTEHLFALEDEKGLFNNILPLFLASDVLIGNLEFPIINNGKGIKKAGPILKGEESYINIFKKSGFNVLSMANNHIKDCGEEGVLSTIGICKKNEIDVVGAGKNEVEAKKPLIIDKNGWKIGVMAFAEHEFNAAYENQAGANLLDVFHDFDAIKEIKQQVDYLIILYHGGVEYYEYPSPLLQKKCRKMIASGADLVTCQHSHCIGTTENFLDGTIVYGQGNTLFGYRKNSKNWNEGFLLKIKLNIKENALKFVPIEAKKQGIQLMEAKKGKARVEQFLNISKEITNKSFIVNSWEQFCNKKTALYLPYLFGFGLYFIRLNRLLKNRLICFFYGKRAMRTSHNIIRCEAHNEVLQTILNKNKDK